MAASRARTTLTITCRRQKFVAKFNSPMDRSEFAEANLWIDTTQTLNYDYYPGLRQIEEDFSYAEHLVARLYPVPDPANKQSAQMFNQFVKMLNAETPKLVGVVT